MGILNFWRGESKSNHVAKSQDYVTMVMHELFHGGSIQAGSYDSMAKNGYQKNGTVFNAARQIALSAGSVPWALFEKNSEVRQRVDDHPLIDLWRRPNEYTGLARFVEEIFLYLHIAGEAFISTSQEGIGPETFETSRGTPDSLILLRPNKVKFKGDSPVGDILWEAPNGKKRVIPRSEVLHLKFFHPTDDLRGLSPIEVASLSIEQSNMAKRWNKSLLSKAGRPGGILRSAAQVPESIKNNIIDRFNADIGGAGKAGDTIFLSGDVSWEKSSLSPEEASWIEGQKMSLRDISVTEGAPSQLNGDNESTTFSNYQEARKALYQERVLPLLTWLRDEVNVWLTPRFGDKVFLDILKKEIDALQEDRSKEWRRLETATWMTVNEKRSSVGLQPVSDPRADTPIRLLEHAEEGPSVEEIDLQRSSDRRVVKAFNLSDQKEIEWHWKQIEEERDSLLPMVSAIIGKQFLAEYDDLVDQIVSSQDMISVSENLEGFLIAHEGDAKKSLEEIYALVALSFGASTMDRLPSRITAEDFVLSKVRQDAALYMEEVAPFKVRKLHETTSKRVKAALIKASEEGRSFGEVTRMIKAEFTDPSRLSAIARTETRAASNLGAQRAAAHSGFDAKKQWITELDNRVRDKHAAAHGQERPLEEPYEVGGELLQFPGDATYASASNIVNCRCTESYIIE